MQLRAENKDRTAFNLVGCQTMLKYGVQKEVFRKIPGLQNAEFLRYGSIHRNSYLNSPELLNDNLSLKALPNVWLAGQFSGVEGYTESISMGMLVAMIIDYSFSHEEAMFSLPETTVLGQFWRRLITPSEQRFQPVNANFGLLPELLNVDKSKKKTEYAERSLRDLDAWIKSNQE
jgi:methylenetetrahydrofolate--tRNA-(uracil-5-)-methyltransferase